MSWLRSLEPFDRQGYAAPIGWIDSAGDAERRVAIRCGQRPWHATGSHRRAGWCADPWLTVNFREVGLKLTVLADQPDLMSGSRQGTQSPLHG